MKVTSTAATVFLLLYVSQAYCADHQQRSFPNKDTDKERLRHFAYTLRMLTGEEAVTKELPEQEQRQSPIERLMQATIRRQRKKLDEK